METPFRLNHSFPKPSSVPQNRKFGSLASTLPARRVALEEVNRVGVEGRASNYDERFALAMSAAKKLHIAQNLSPSRTVVEKRQNPPPSPELFVAMRPDSDANSVLLRGWHKEGQRAAFRVFFDCIYAECGYVPWYLREDYGNLIQPQSRLQCLVHKTKRKRTSHAKAKQVVCGAETCPSSVVEETSPLSIINETSSSPVDEENQMLRDDNLSHAASPSEDASSGDCEYTEEEKKRYVRWEAVKHKIETGEMGKVVTGDLIYLAGRECGYHALHTSHHSMLLTVLAVQLERITAPFSRRRRRALKRAFKWLTGYENYSDAWKNPNEERILTDKGMVGGDLGFHDPVDDNDSDEGKNTDDED
jgi:hypothetical protein